ncbi:hypothetical protein C6T65_17565 [Burkholderia vietnamiensis]|uniref:HNH nuclease domain-containing protein n=1 Tax=Burkholderia vietnamiensis TaxID=60552 RepID=A0AA44XZE9_BURVI|nr:hypothetical protein [Burkholderia vietnamiensis]PRH41094.1 hypothetical protein C6T65_17565 [Burkholderia vietnamiensis]
MCAWPDARKSSFSSESVARDRKEKRKAARLKERRDNAAGMFAAGRIVSSPIRDRNHERNTKLLHQILEKLRGLEFRAWYEATTGEPVDEWLEDVAMSPAEFIERFPEPRMTQFEWIEDRIRRIAERHPWTDPERRAQWGAEIAACESYRDRRRMLIRLGAPRWANMSAMIAIYRERAKIERETGIPHDVDHIVPVVNPLVCGLHWEGNLRIIPARDNRSKSNSFDTDPPIT